MEELRCRELPWPLRTTPGLLHSDRLIHGLFFFFFCFFWWETGSVTRIRIFSGEAGQVVAVQSPDTVGYRSSILMFLADSDL